MHEADLIGYLLNLLDEEEKHRVASSLAQSEQLQARLQHWQTVVQPLGWDREHPSPPQDLLIATLLRVARYRVEQEQASSPAGTEGPAALPDRGPAPTFSLRAGLRRRIDLVIAVAIVLLVTLLIPPLVLEARQQYHELLCRNNLRQFHSALVQYESRYKERPGPEREGPLAWAGVYACQLREAGLLSADVTVVCPARPMPAPDIPSCKQLGTASADQLAKWRREAGGCYGYYLGYMENNELRRLSRRVLEKCCDSVNLGEIPVMADRPPRRSELPLGNGNSPNHNQRGQNVLFYGGHVRFVTSCRIGTDHIYLNRDGRCAAGLSPDDAVLAPSEMPPLP